MIDGELFKMRDAAKQKVDLLNIPNDYLNELVFNALSFESDSITKEDVANVLNGREDKINPTSVSLINNQKNAYMHIFEMVKDNIPMTENNLKDLHQILMEGFSDIGGLYRNVDISVNGSNHTPPSHIKVYDRMKKYFDYCLQEPTVNLFEYISYCHLQIAKIHPFLDGNGRLSRLILNYQLMRHGFMPVIVTKESRKEYFETLEEFKVNKNINPFIEYLKNLEIKSLKTVL